MQFSTLSTLTDLAGTAGECNAGGITRLRLVAAQCLAVLKPERFAPITEAGYPDYTISSQHLTFTDDAQLIDVAFLSEYASFSDPFEATVNGILYKPTIQIVLPKVRRDVVAWVAANAGIRFVAFLQDRNGFFRMVGLPEEPLGIVATFAQEVGKGKNQSVLTFTGQTQQPAYFVDSGIENTDLLYAGAFGDEFGNMFDT